MVQAYSDMEVQRYAEGLTLEYFEKANLNSRIIRLGEIIGDGVDFGSNTAFVNLVMNAVRGENLTLQNDGLETEWFVHVLDAAYALIKAQFSKGTEGKLFSVCYDNTFTHLSIAYKIQEIEESSKEIQFMESGISGPPIKIYKPAPNLSAIGWMPRVSFDKAVRQSIASAKIYIMERGLNKIRDDVEDHDYDGRFTGKFRSLMGKSPKESAKPDSSSPISRLIAQKKQEDDLRRDRIRSAELAIRDKKRSRPLSFSEKIQHFIWTNFIRLANVFSFMRRQSPLEFGVFIFVMLIFVVFYFTILSPFLVLSRNLLIIQPEYERAKDSAGSANFQELNGSMGKIDEALTSTVELLDRYEFVTEFASLENEFSSIKKLTDSYRLLVDGVTDISYGLEPYNEYLDLFENNTQLRSGTDGYLSIAQPGVNYSDVLGEIQIREAFINNGIEKADKAIEQIKVYDYSVLPPKLASRVKSLNAEILSFQEGLAGLQNYRYIPEILGVGEPKTYLILALDNTRLTPIGGDISAFAQITMSNGSIQEITVKSIDDVTLTTSSLDTLTLDEINNRRYSLKDSGTIKSTDLATIGNYDKFSNTIATLWQESFGAEIDGVMTMNLNAFEDFIESSESEDLAIVGGIEFSDKNALLANIKAAQSGNANLVSKRSVIAQLFAALLNQSFDFLTDKNSEILLDLNSSAKNQNMAVSIPEQDIKDYIEQSDLNMQKLYDSESYVSVGINVEDPKIVSFDRYPSVNLALKTLITEEYQLNNELTVVFPNYGTTQEVSVCLPSNTLLNTISVDAATIPEQRVTVNSTEDEVCVVAQVLAETQLNLTWSVESYFAADATDVDLNLAVAKVRGSNTTIDYSVSTEAGVEIKGVNLPISFDKNKLVFSQSIFSDLGLELKLSK